MTTPVTFKTAVKAKEKGFDMEVGSYYDLDYDPWKYIEPQLYDMARKQDWNKTDERVSAPTQSELSKWLREEKDIYVLPSVSYPASDRWGVDIYKTDGVANRLVDSIHFMDTYESAYEAGLDKALDLIWLKFDEKV